MSRILIITCLCLIGQCTLIGQQIITLDQVIKKAHDQSIQTKINQRISTLGSLDYQIFRKSMMPSLRLNATVPNLNRSLEAITLPDGTDDFIERSLMTSNLGLSIDQPLIWTGGNLTFNSQLQRIDIFGNNPNSSYLANPISLGFSQPIFGFNNFRWARKISPLQSTIAEKQTIENKEDVAISAVMLYYDWLTAEANYQLAEKFSAHNDTIYQISKGRFDMGKIAENDLLQAELNSLNSDINVKQAELQLQLNKMRMSQLIMEQIDGLEPIIDTNLETIDIPIDKAIILAQESMSTYDGYLVDKLSAQRELAMAKSNNSPTVNLFASYGLTNSAAEVNDALTDPQNRQVVVVNMEVPIYQFGLNRSQTQRAKINQEMVGYNLQIEQQNLEQSIFERISNFTLLQKQVSVSKRADEVANKGYLVTRQRFMIGKVDLIELNQAVTRKTSARMDYINALRNYWIAYYEIRKLTHYDFENDKPLTIK